MSQYSKRIRNHLSRSAGHLMTVKRMVDEERDYTEVMMQLSAVRSSLNGVSNQIMIEQIRTEIAKAVSEGDDEKIKKLNETISKYF